MERLAFSTMVEKKTEFLRIRTDPELKRALREAALKHDRTEADHARHLLRMMLGLTELGQDHVLAAEAQALYEQLTGKHSGPGRRAPPSRKATG